VEKVIIPISLKAGDISSPAFEENLLLVGRGLRAHDDEAFFIPTLGSQACVWVIKVDGTSMPVTKIREINQSKDC
jgi:hypothetical protein